MKVVLSININKERAPYIVSTFRGSELVFKRPAKVLAYYDVCLLNTKQVSIFSVELIDNEIVQFDECDFVFSENDYPLRKYLLDLNLFEEKVDKIIESVRNEINNLYFDKKESAFLEIET